MDLHLHRVHFLVHYTFTAESGGERILKIGQHLAKLWARERWPVTFGSRLLVNKCVHNAITDDTDIFVFRRIARPYR